METIVNKRLKYFWCQKFLPCSGSLKRNLTEYE